MMAYDSHTAMTSLPQAANQNRYRITVLEHMPGASEGAVIPHFDWLFALDRQAALPLTTFRCPMSPAMIQIGESIRIERIKDHRPLFLDYEGLIGPGPGGADRGFVRIVLRGYYRSAGPMTPPGNHLSALPQEVIIWWTGTSAGNPSGATMQDSSAQTWRIDTGAQVFTRQA